LLGGKNGDDMEENTGMQTIVDEEKPIGTVEPIYKESDKQNYETIGFVRGFVEKYKDVKLGQQNIFFYLKQLVD
jgi:hypothetical protein